MTQRQAPALVRRMEVMNLQILPMQSGRFRRAVQTRAPSMSHSSNGLARRPYPFSCSVRLDVHDGSVVYIHPISGMPCGSSSRSVVEEARDDRRLGRLILVAARLFKRALAPVSLRTTL